MATDDAEQVLSRYEQFPGSFQRPLARGNAGGWSGSQLWKVVAGSGDEYCLRRWPIEHPSIERLEFIHGVLRMVPPQMPIVACPVSTRDGKSFVQHVGHLWELTPWLPGKADYHDHPSRTRLAAAIDALAHFHELSAKIETSIAAPPKVFLDRQKMLKFYRQDALSLVERAMAVAYTNEVDAIAKRLFQLATKGIWCEQLWQPLSDNLRLPVQPVIRDIKHDHVLFTGDEVTGIIDFGAMRIDTPLADVARLVGSLVGDDSATHEFALERYSNHRPLDELARRLIRFLDESHLVFAALNWLTWLYIEYRDMGPAGPILGRLNEIEMRLKSLLA